MGAISPPVQIPRLAFRALLATPGHARCLQRRDEHPGPPRRHADSTTRQDQRRQKPLRWRLAVLEPTVGPRPAETATGGQVVKAAERPLCPVVGYASRQRTSWKYITRTATGTTTASPTWCCSTATATTAYTANGVYDKDPRTEEPDEVKVSRPVREWRRGGRPPRRP